MKADADSLAYELLASAFSGDRSQLNNLDRAEVERTVSEARQEHYESPTRRRLRYWGLGPVWARRLG